MKSALRHQLLLATTGVLVAIATVFSMDTLADTAGVLSRNSEEILLGLLCVGLGAFVSYWLQAINRNPVPLKVALLGPPRCGKTVYLTVLFSELQLYQKEAVRFEPYGVETIEAVSSNFSALTQGKWLKPTSVDSVFFFRANAVLGSGFGRRKYTIEIGDYAGEHLGELDPSTSEWIHRTGYFDYAVGSDIIFLAIDASVLSASEGARAEDAQIRLIAALQMLIEKKGVPPGKQLRAPVGLLILKSDLLILTPKERKDIEQKLRRLLDTCVQRCLHFEIFYVSAVGSIDGSGHPPKEIRPQNVIDPMLWALDSV